MSLLHILSLICDFLFFFLGNIFPFLIRKMNLLQMYCGLRHNKVVGRVKVTIFPLALGAFYKVMVGSAPL